MIHCIIIENDDQQFRYSLEIEGDDEYYEIHDALEFALDECKKLQADKITIYNSKFFHQRLYL